MDHRVSHDLDLETARRVADKAWASYAERFEKYSPTIDWATERLANIGFSAGGFSLGGSIELLDGAIELTMDVPFIMRPFKKRAIEIIEREMKKWIGVAKAGDL